MLFRYAETVHVDAEMTRIGRIRFVQRIGQACVGGFDDEGSWMTCFKVGAEVAEMRRSIYRETVAEVLFFMNREHREERLGC